MILPFEATDYDELPAVVDARRLRWKGGVDLLINNAGVSQRSLALDTAFDTYRRMMEIDFFAPVRLTQLVLPSMVARKSGHIVIISSVAGKVGAPLRTGYCAAKHACVGYYDALRAEIEKAYGVGVSVVTPGSVKTGIAKQRDDGRRRRAWPLRRQYRQRHGARRRRPTSSLPASRKENAKSSSPRGWNSRRCRCATPILTLFSTSSHRKAQGLRPRETLAKRRTRRRVNN